VAEPLEPLQGECVGSTHQPLHGPPSVDVQEMIKGMVSRLGKMHHEKQLESLQTSELSPIPPLDWFSILHSEHFAAGRMNFWLTQSLLRRQGGEGSGAVRLPESA
jgi:hypothetical protein